jgi:hypothetical protein
MILPHARKLKLMLFAIVSLGIQPALAGTLATAYPNDWIQVPDSPLYFVWAAGTAKDVSDKIGITSGNLGPVVVLAVSGYYGRAPMNIWEWIAAKITAPPIVAK